MNEDKLRELAELVEMLNQEVCDGWEYSRRHGGVTVYQESANWDSFEEYDKNRASVRVMVFTDCSGDYECRAETTLTIAGEASGIPEVHGDSVIGVAREACKRANNEIDEAIKKAKKVKFEIGD